MKLVDIDSLNPSTYNPRAADPRRLDLIELSLRKLGFVLPIYATPDGEIISGHQRHHVAKRMGVRQVPVAITKSMELPERKAVMPTFHEVQFPPKIAYGASGGPMFNTSIVTTFGGFEQRNVNWQKARGRWDVSTGLKNKTDMDTLQAFFRARFGKAYGFRFKDWTDYQAVGQVLGNGNGVITTLQLTKLYTSGSNTYSREIKKPVTGTIKIYLNGVLQGAGYTVDLTTGVVTFSSAPGAGVVVSADFDFDVPVRFDTDALAVRADGPGIYVWDAIPVVEIRV